MNRQIAHRVGFIAGLLFITLCIGTAGFTLIEGFSFFDAFYMTLTTITTVGYQEIHPLSHAGRLFNSLLILFGVTAMFFSVGVMTQTIIEMQLQDRYGKGRKKRMIQQMKNHYIVCGFGRVGRSASHELQRSRVPFVVMDRSEQRVERATQAQMTALVSDATSDDCLREAGIMQARGFISALPTDADNVFVILSAKTLNPQLTVVTRASEEGAEEKLRRAGADVVFSPYSIAGQRLAQTLVRPHASHFLDLDAHGMGPDVSIEQFRIAPGSPFALKPLAGIGTPRNLGVIILAIRKADGEMIFNPSGETEIASGDSVIAIGKQLELRNLEKLFAGA